MERILTGVITPYNYNIIKNTALRQIQDSSAKQATCASIIFKIVKFYMRQPCVRTALRRLHGISIQAVGPICGWIDAHPQRWQNMQDAYDNWDPHNPADCLRKWNYFRDFSTDIIAILGLGGDEQFGNERNTSLEIFVQIPRNHREFFQDVIDTNRDFRGHRNVQLQLPEDAVRTPGGYSEDSYRDLLDGMTALIAMGNPIPAHWLKQTRSGRTRLANCVAGIARIEDVSLRNEVQATIDQIGAIATYAQHANHVARASAIAFNNSLQTSAAANNAQFAANHQMRNQLCLLIAWLYKICGIQPQNIPAALDGIGMTLRSCSAKQTNIRNAFTTSPDQAMQLVGQNLKAQQLHIYSCPMHMNGTRLRNDMLIASQVPSLFNALLLEPELQLCFITLCNALERFVTPRVSEPRTSFTAYGRSLSRGFRPMMRNVTTVDGSRLDVQWNVDVGNHLRIRIIETGRVDSGPWFGGGGGGGGGGDGFDGGDGGLGPRPGEGPEPEFGDDEGPDSGDDHDPNNENGEGDQYDEDGNPLDDDEEQTEGRGRSRDRNSRTVTQSQSRSRDRVNHRDHSPEGRGRAPTPERDIDEETRVNMQQKLNAAKSRADIARGLAPQNNKK